MTAVEVVERALAQGGLDEDALVDATGMQRAAVREALSQIEHLCEARGRRFLPAHEAQARECGAVLHVPTERKPSDDERREAAEADAARDRAVAEIMAVVDTRSRPTLCSGYGEHLAPHEDTQRRDCRRCGRGIGTPVPPALG